MSVFCNLWFADISFVLDVTNRWQGRPMKMQYTHQSSLPSSPKPSRVTPQQTSPASSPFSTPPSSQTSSPASSPLLPPPPLPPPRSTQPSTQPSTQLYVCNKHSNGRPPVPAQRTHYAVPQNEVPQLPKSEHCDERDNTPLQGPRKCFGANDQDVRKPRPVPTAKKPVVSELHNQVEQNDTQVSGDNNRDNNGIYTS